jgi:hypothetical protein
MGSLTPKRLDDISFQQWNLGMRGALTTAPHMSLWVVYPVLLGFSALFLWTGTRNFRRRVIS